MVDHIIGGGKIFSYPLISFNTIVDLDISLLSYIIMHVRNTEIFDFDKISHLSPMELLKEVYIKKYINPLYIIMRDEKDKEFLDECYNEFLDNGEYLDYYCIGTDFYRLVQEFVEAPEIQCTILCRNEKELQMIKEDDILSKTTAILKDNISKEYTQYYFRYIEDSVDFLSLTNKTFYFSSTCSNLNDERDDTKESDIIQSIISNRNSISIFDLYREDRIGKVIQ